MVIDHGQMTHLRNKAFGTLGHGYSPSGTWEKANPVRSPSSPLESQQPGVPKPYRWTFLGHAQVQIQNVCHLLHIFNCIVSTVISIN